MSVTSRLASSRRRWVEIVFFIVMAVFIISEHRNNERVEALALTVCANQQEGRAQDNARGRVLIDFLAGTADVRQASADNESGDQRTIDLAAARTFRELLSHVRILPPVRC